MRAYRRYAPTIASTEAPAGIATRVRGRETPDAFLRTLADDWRAGEAPVSTHLVTDVTRTVAGTRVGFDVDGDGHEDVFILLGGANSSTFRIGTMIANDHTAAPEVPLIGQPSNDAGHFGDAPVR